MTTGPIDPAGIRAVLIDLGGVLTVDPWETLLLTPGEGMADRLALSRDRVAHAGAVLWERHCRTPTTEHEYWSQFALLTDATIPPSTVVDVERRLLVATPDAHRIVTALRRSRRPWGLITNNTAFWYDKQLALLGIDADEPRWQFTSFDSGVAKGDDGTGLFEVAAAEVDSTGVLVIDDRESNIARAVSCGFGGRMYTVGDEMPLIDRGDTRGTTDVEAI